MFIRSRTQERTGYQNGAFPVDSIDNQCDFVMVYRLDENTENRIKAYRDLGYVIHFMTGISWGHYLTISTAISTAAPTGTRPRRTGSEIRSSTARRCPTWCRRSPSAITSRRS